MRFADYFGRAFSSVTTSQFPWVKLLRESPVAKVADRLFTKPKYHGQEKLPLFVWMVAQASEGDLAVGLYLWSHLILPIVGTKSGSNPQTRDIILQLAERILSTPKAQTILINGTVRKGERLMPPSALDLLLRAIFPSTSARVKAIPLLDTITLSFYEYIHNLLIDGYHIDNRKI